MKKRGGPSLYERMDVVREDKIVVRLTITMIIAAVAYAFILYYAATLRDSLQRSVKTAKAAGTAATSDVSYDNPR